MKEQLYCEINGKWIPFHKLPCAKCEWRYSIHCPHGCWNADGQHNTYGGKMMTEEEARKENEQRKE